MGIICNPTKYKENANEPAETSSSQSFNRGCFTTQAALAEFFYAVRNSCDSFLGDALHFCPFARDATQRLLDSCRENPKLGNTQDAEDTIAKLRRQTFSLSDLVKRLEVGRFTTLLCTPWLRFPSQSNIFTPKT